MVKRIGRYIFRFLMVVLTVFVVVLTVFVCYFLFGGALCNDLRAAKIERVYSSMELPEGVIRVETASYVGNTSGAGNLTEIWAGMLIYSEVSEDELGRYFDGYDVWAVPADLTNQCPYAERFMGFMALNGKNSGDGYFVISDYYNAFTQMDLRGH